MGVWKSIKKYAPAVATAALGGPVAYQVAGWIGMNEAGEGEAKAQSANPQADADFAEQQRLEQEKLAKQESLVKQLYGQADQYDTDRQKALAAMGQQTQNSDAEARRLAAESMAMAGGGTRGGGGAYGALLQAGRQAGDDSRTYMDQRAKEQQQFNLSSLEDIAAMRNAAAGQDIEAMGARLEYGTPTARAEKRWAEVQPELQATLDKYSGTYVGEQSAAAQEIYAMAAREPDPIVRQRLNDYAKQVQDGTVDV